MTALTADRNTLLRDDVSLTAPVAAGERIHAGALVAFDAAGNAVPAREATGLKGAGRAEEAADNSTGGGASVRLRKGVFHYASDGITRAHIGSPAYAIDDQTVSASDGGGKRSAIGTVFDCDAQGAWVLIS